MKILIDPGHGFCPDEKGVWVYDRPESFGVREDLLTPHIGKRLFNLLKEAGHEVHTTRPFPGTPEGDELGTSGQPRWKEDALFWFRACWSGHPEYQEVGSNLRSKGIMSRPFYANRIVPDVAVSLHINASDSNPMAHGVEVWHRYLDTASHRLAELTYSEMTKDNRFDGARGLKGGGPGEREIIRAKQLAWFREMKQNIPVILVEFLFFSNQTDAKLLADPAVLSQAGDAIFRGIQAFEKGRKK